MNKMYQFYQKYLRNYPIPVLQAGSLMGAGDMISQFLVEKKNLNEYSLSRTAKFAAVGFIVAGPALTTWYTFLAKKFGEGGAKVAIKKVACDQLGFAPPFIATLLTAIGIAQRKPFEEIKTEFKKNYKDVLVNNYKLWPMVQMVNFFIVPLKHQVLLVQFVALFWNTYLAWKTQT